jgi:WhiB family redox-sensing transcriptional regulator
MTYDRRVRAVGPALTADGVRAWMTDALCRDDDRPEDWFAETPGRHSREEIRALMICRHCDVAGDCLEYALAEGLDHGLWAATTAEDRKRIRRKIRDTNRITRGQDT